jgi:parallel beta-helix repeat protein
MSFENNRVSAGTPDDGVDGTQYVDGDWYVNDTQSYTDENIILSGNLIINSGGHLTLNHVILAMNCTFDGEYGIEVKDGGTLIITDIDCDPATVNDFSNLTDSPFDTDNGSFDFDFEYAFMAYPGSSLTITNSIVREAGYGDLNGAYGIQSNSDNTTIENCTFSDNYYSIFLYNAMDYKVGNNDISNSEYGIYSYVSRGTIFQNDLGYNENGIRIWGFDDEIRNNNVFFNNNIGMEINGNNLVVDGNTVNDNYHGIYSKFAANVQISNNEVFGNTQYGIYASDDQIQVHDNLAYQNQYGIYARGDEIDIYNNTAHNNTEVGLYLTNLFDSEIYNNVLIYNGGTSWTHNLYIGFSGNLDVHNNTIQKLKPNSYHAVMIRDTDNLDFIFNTVTYNDDQAVRCDINTNSDTNLKFNNNNISNNNGVGLYVYGRYNVVNYAEVMDNVFYSNSGWGYYISRLLSYKITNNIISGASSGVFIDATQNGDFSNNTIDVTGNNFYIRDTHGANDDTFFETVNCSFDDTKVWLTQGYATLIISNFLHIKVSDTNGPISNAHVWANSTLDPGSSSFEGYTDGEGYIRYIVLKNQTQKDSPSGTEYNYFDPHNITALSYGVTAYGEIEPTMNRSQTVNVVFSSDLPPEAPSNLIAISNGTNVDLSWTESHSLDLKSYLVYRNNTGGGWVMVYDSEGTGKDKETTWSDPLAASDWSTYSYKVVAKDLSGKTSDDSNIAGCGDWVVDDNRIVSDFSTILNGSLIVLASGSLTLINVDISFNSSYSAEFGVDVRSGGALYIYDGDNNPQTEDDQSIISEHNPGVAIYFKVQSDLFEMKNSRLSGVGDGSGLGLSWWNPEDGYRVADIGDPSIRGLYITGSNVIIENCNISDNFVGIMLDGSVKSQIQNNDFYNNFCGVYLVGSQDVLLDQNRFLDNSPYSTYIYNSGMNIVSNNEYVGPIIYPLSFNWEAGIVIYGLDSHNNTVDGNNLTRLNVGIHMEITGENNIISNNYVYTLGLGMEIRDSYSISLTNNDAYDTSDVAFEIWTSSDIVITGGSITLAENGYYIRSSDNVIVSDVTAEESFFGVVMYFCTNSLISNIYANNCEGGLGIVGGDDNIITDSTVENSVFGILVFWGATNVRIKDTNVDTGTEQGFMANDASETIIENSSFDCTLSNFNLSLASVLLYNVTYDQTKVVLDNSSSIALYWLVDILVLDWFSAPVPNANIQIRKPLGTLVYNGICDSQGYIKYIWMHERTQFKFSNETSTPYFIQATSGNHSGTSTFFLNISTETKVILENTAPSVSNAVISPTLPTTIDDLTLSYLYSDPEFDPEGSSMILWYIDGVHNTSLNDQMVINSADTKKGQTWFCEVIPHDGALYGVPMTSTPVTIQNTAPSVSKVAIDKLNPSSSESIMVSYDFSDIDNDVEGLSLHRWYVDSGAGFNYSGVDSLELDWVYTQKGEIWKCIVTPSDGEDLGSPMESSPVTIGNTAPEVSDVMVTPSFPESNETLLPDYTYYDLDADPETGGSIAWYKNGIMQNDLSDIFQVEPTKTQAGEKWYYIITPSDGFDSGSPVQSTSVQIANTPPSVSNIIITPSNPSTADDLVAGYDFYDEDGDLESEDTIIKWYRMRPGDIVFTYTGYQGSTLSSAFTTKGEIWKCEIIPHDGLNYGPTLLSSVEVTIGNSPPVTTDAAITPSSPTTRDDLEANYDYYDQDGDPESGSEISWYRNGVLQSNLNGQLTVSNVETQKGDQWYFTVKPSDDANTGSEVQSPSVEIKNSAPEARNLKITPREPSGEQNIAASYEYYDEDGDPEATVEILWYKNGLLYDLGETGDDFIILSSSTEKGDIWFFEIRVADGLAFSEINTSHFVEIKNSIPKEISISPAPSTIPINETDTLDFFADIEDPDGDFLLYKWRLRLTSVGDNEYFQLITDYDSAGEYVLNLTVQDIGENSGSLFYEWNIIVNNVNREPEIDVREPISTSPKIKEGDSLRFIIDESDPDTGETPTITWYLDDGVAQTGGSSYTYVADDLASGWHDIKAVVSDGTDTTEYTWDLNVQDVAEEELMGLSYDAWGLILAILSGLVAMLLFVFGLYRVRRRKGALKTYMAEIDEISTRQDENPVVYQSQLNELEDKINSDFRAGNVEDLHYLMLQEILATRRGDVRKAAISQKFEKLPEGVASELDDMLKDGKITKEEYQSFVATMNMTKSLTGDQKKELSKMIEKWEFEDKDLVEGDSSEKKIEPKKVEEDEKIEEMISSEEEKKEE